MKISTRGRLSVCKPNPGGALESAEARESSGRWRQGSYQIAPFTQDNTAIVPSPPDASHSPTLRKALKDVGADLARTLTYAGVLPPGVGDSGMVIIGSRTTSFRQFCAFFSSPSATMGAD